MPLIISDENPTKKEVPMAGFPNLNKQRSLVAMKSRTTTKLHPGAKGFYYF